MSMKHVKIFLLRRWYVIGSAALHDRLVEEYAQQRLEGASDTIKARVAQVTQQLRHATFTNLKKWEECGCTPLMCYVGWTTRKEIN